MSEINPITPTRPMIGPRRIEREDKQPGDERQPPKQEDKNESDGDGDPVQHIDEIV